MKPSARIVAASAVVVLLAIALVYSSPALFAQEPNTPTEMPDTMQQHHQQMMQMHAQEAKNTGTRRPTMPGQDAFGAIQEIVGILEADPKTDWSKVDLEALRQHLIDMNDVTLKADAAAKPVNGGLEIAITGKGRTVAAIQRIVPAHAQQLSHMNGWSAKTAPLPNGELLTVTSSDPQEVQHIRGLGFIGLMVSGSHHQMHHLAMAKGEFVHSH
jgi:antitoxin (DNA-binding transcriptional repressor) of toxin-antitoxin stability system